MMSLKSASVLGSLVALALAVGCSPGDELVPVGGNAAGSPDPGLGPGTAYRDDALRADESVSADVEVREDALVLPFAGHEDLETTLRVGMVFAGDPAPGLPAHNPLGFLRRIQRIGREGDKLVLQTTHARLEELFATADFTIEAAMPAAPGDVNGQAGNVQLQDADPSGNSYGAVDLFDQTIALSGSTPKSPLGGGTISGSFREKITVWPWVKFDYQQGTFGPSLVQMDISLPLRRSETYCASLTGKSLVTTEKMPLVSSTIGPRNTIRFGETSRIEELKRKTVPIQLKIEVSATCFAALEGGMDYSLTNDTYYGPFAQVGYDSNVRGLFADLQDRPNPTKDVTRRQFTAEGGGVFRCDMPIRVGLYLFDTLGAFFEYVPGAQMQVKGHLSLGTDIPLRGQGFVQLDMLQQLNAGISVDFFGIEEEANWKIADLPTINLLYETTQTDSCANRPDGWYCSEIEASSPNGFKCENHATTGASACLTGQYCQPAGGDANHAQLDDIGQPKCSTDRPGVPAKPKVSCK